MADARVTDQNLLDAFQEGVGSSTAEDVNPDDWMLVVQFLFEGTAINVTGIEWTEQPMSYPIGKYAAVVHSINEHLAQGPGAAVNLGVVRRSEYETAQKALSRVPEE